METSKKRFYIVVQVVPNPSIAQRFMSIIGFLSAVFKHGICILIDYSAPPAIYNVYVKNVTPSKRHLRQVIDDES